MNIINRVSTATDLYKITEDLTQGLNESYLLGFLFISSFQKDSTTQIAASIKKSLQIECLVGCSCGGIIGQGNEVEQQPACSLILVDMKEVTARPFYIDLSGIRSLETREDWYNFFDVYPNENPNFLILPDPFSLDTGELLKGINEHYPKSPVIGGLASGATQARGNVIFINDQIYDEGLVGVVLKGNIHFDTVVSQGCRPIGENYIVTRAEGNIIHELAGKPLYDVLDEVLTKESSHVRKLAEEAIFVGIAMNEYKHDMSRGDYLIRLLMGIDSSTGAGAVADYVRRGQTIRFHVRDAASATDDLNALLQTYCKEHPKSSVEGALVFSCNGRGFGLFQEKDHDIKIIQKYVNKVPMAGFFCAGEIGPVGGKNFLHGFTCSIALFYQDK